MRNYKNKIVILLIFILFSSNIPVFGAIKEDSINLDPKKIEYVDYSNGVYLEMKNIINNIDTYRKNENISLMYNIIDSLTKLSDELELSDIDKHKPNDQLDFCYYSIYDLLLTNPTEQKNEVMMYFADKLYKTTVLQIKKYGPNPFTFESYVTWGFINSYNSKKGLISISYPKKTVEIFKIVYINLYMLINNPKAVIDDSILNFIPSKSVTNDMLNPDLIIGDEDELIDDDVNTDDNIDKDKVLENVKNKIKENMNRNYVLTYYKAVNNLCYKVKLENNNGFVNSKYEDVPKSDYSYCGIYDYITKDPVEFYTTGYFEAMIKGVLNTSKKLSDESIKYTMNKEKDDIKKYKDTRIRIFKDSTLNYKMVKSALNFISKDSKNSTVLKDKNAFLIVIDGYPYFTYENNDYFTKEQVENIFNNSNSIDIKIID